MSIVQNVLQWIRRGASPRSEDLLGASGFPDQTVILIFNSMWGQPFETGSALLPPGCRFTTDIAQLDRASAVVFHIPSLERLPATKPRGQLWVAWSLECDANYPQLRDPEFMRQFDLTMTYRLDADVVVAYTSYFGDPGVLVRMMRTPPRPKTPDKLASMFISSGVDRSGRLEYAAELMRYLDVHSYGKVFHNRDIGRSERGRATKLEIMADYKFDLAFENAITQDYVSEKFFDPLAAGSVPVYLGAPNVETFAPGDRCFINTADFQSPKELAEYLLYLHHDDAAYAEYVAWKRRPFLPEFEALLATQETSIWMRLCHVVQARRVAQVVTFSEK